MKLFSNYEKIIEFIIGGVVNRPIGTLEFKFTHVLVLVWEFSHKNAYISHDSLMVASELQAHETIGSGVLNAYSEVVVDSCDHGHRRPDKTSCANS